MMTTGKNDQLVYHGTSDEVRLGDRVRLTRLIRKPVYGTVTYMPGVSPRHREMEWPEFSRWAIELDDGTVMSWPYVPEELQPSKRLQLVRRGDPDYEGLKPADELK
ncbi:MAG TPA: hypothetical protein VF701_21085 [Thermoanaerobaculia bacterium]